MPRRLPLTFQQQWLWELAQRHESWRCMATYTFRLRGVLDVPLLRQSFEEVIRRHESLRTRIVVVEGVAQQQVEEPRAHPLDSVPVAGAGSILIESNARRAVEDLCDLRMDFYGGALWHARLLRLSEDEHWLVLSMHRLIGDCVSIDQTYREIQLVYGEWAQGRQSALGVPMQYGDYATSQQQTSGEWLQRHGPFWTKRLAGAAPIRWQSDPCAPLVPRESLGKTNCLFGAELSASLRDLARKARTLAATLMLAVYVAVLWQWCRQKDFVLPFNIAGRQSEHKSVIGYFSYILYLRLEVTGNETFRGLLRSIGNEFFASLSHQDFGRMAMRHPELLSGTLFQWVTWHPDDAALSSASATKDPLKQTIDRVPVRDFGEGLTIVPPGLTALEVTFFDTAEGLCALGSYRADCFAANTMARFMADLRSAAEIFVRNPDAQVAAISQERGDVDGPLTQRAASGDRDIQCDAVTISAEQADS